MVRKHIIINKIAVLPDVITDAATLKILFLNGDVVYI
jgi:hypothetical protein